MCLLFRPGNDGNAVSLGVLQLSSATVPGTTELVSTSSGEELEKMYQPVQDAFDWM